ncbi:hypothetical protein QBC47DRAFT_445089 [Echria macrotheca]|uniref:NACHT domain-containing protein n=1 Tax=Echria macrotheca TaxID=438768 RepID=A0AAJ0FCU8_9PEZI|nr:hypothetical protein QBC47DRAFT_445089 [Echria macrotheca]
MESLVALGLASNVIQFVDFASKLISTAHTLYVSSTGSTAENAELEVLATHIRALADSFCPHAAVATSNAISNTTRGNAPAPKPDALHDLASQCRHVADQLLALLASFTVQGRHRTWKSMRTALRASHRSAEMDSILARLDRISSQMAMHVVFGGLKDIAGQMEVLRTENKRLGATRNNDINQLEKAVRTMLSRLSEVRADPSTAPQSQREALVPFSATAAKVLQYSHEQQILRGLYFEGMDDRRKPGSGKSTLMKYLCNHPMLAHNLKAWAGARQLFIAKYFFWNLGKDILHKSQIGLLRALLYQILRLHPDLLRVAFPSSRDDGGLPGTGDVTDSADPLSIEGLLSAFKRIKTGLFTSQIRLFFIIDGLDEYHGKPIDIIRLLEILQDSPHIKVCISSRPWNEFENAFGRRESRRIYMERLTRSDIENYVRDTFDGDPSYRELRDDDDGICDELVGEIVNEAKGVFLWVRLVVQSLLEGITNEDRMVDLRRRLRSLPADLEEYFRRIVFTVDPFYRQQTAHFFRVTIEASVTLPLIMYWFMDQEDPVQYAVKLDVSPLIMQATNRNLKQARKRLNACCKGILEVQYYDSDEAAENSLSSSVLFNWKVDFLHRTARDFLLTENMSNQLVEWTAGGCDPHASICAAIICLAKVAPQEEEYFVPGGPVTKLRDPFIVHCNLLGCEDMSRFGVWPPPGALEKIIDAQRRRCGMVVEMDDSRMGVKKFPAFMGKDFFQKVWQFW